MIVEDNGSDMAVTTHEYVRRQRGRHLTLCGRVPVARQIEICEQRQLSTDIQVFNGLRARVYGASSIKRRLVKKFQPKCKDADAYSNSRWNKKKKSRKNRFLADNFFALSMYDFSAKGFLCWNYCNMLS